ncbi:urea transporter 2-like isoform X2 [Thalassophryne amazonica]|uniref:urea transporter 2-like isoform X2 n=1 Tax=Thalassophryne amazonica TaxID=390379 RepID=UPI0014719732|nr:urea transporter 2-like isoform X2 [Thalassophryne amazonica]
MKLVLLQNNMENIDQPSREETSAHICISRTIGVFTGDMAVCAELVKKQAVAVQLVDWIFRGVAQVVFVNNPVSGLLITAGLFLQNPWWALNGLLGTLISTVSAVVLGQNRAAISAGLFGYNGTLVGTLLAVFSAKGKWYWWLFLPNVFLSMLCPMVSSALSSVATKWDVPIFTLPFNILLCLHIAATGANHPYFPEVDFFPKIHPHPVNITIEGLSTRISQLFLSVPIGVGQVYGCDSVWTGGLFLLAMLLSSPTICLHATLGSAIGMLSGVFYVLTWQTHLLALTCALFCAYMASALSNLMSLFSLPACTWPFCLSTLVFLLVSSEIPAMCRLPLSVVAYPEENRRYRRRLEASAKTQQSGSQEGAQLKESGGTQVQMDVE